MFNQTRPTAPAVKLCQHCDKPIPYDGSDARMFEDICDDCGREYACDNPDALGPDA